MATPFSSKCKILGDLWLNFKNDEDFAPFISHNDMGLPLAFFISEGLVEPKHEDVETFINDTWDMFAAGLKLSDDEEYTDLKTILDNFDENASWN